MMKEEIWKRYKNREMDVEISNYGNVRGKCRIDGVFTEDMIVIRQGRRCIKNHHYPIYALVWKLFNENVITEKRDQIHHIDKKKMNDRLDNLIIMSQSDHMYLHNLRHHRNKGIKLSDEHRQKLSDSHKGQKAWNLGKKLSEEHKQKLHEAWVRRKNKKLNEQLNQI